MTVRKSERVHVTGIRWKRLTEKENQNSVQCLLRYRLVGGLGGIVARDECHESLILQVVRAMRLCGTDVLWFVGIILLIRSSPPTLDLRTVVISFDQLTFCS